MHLPTRDADSLRIAIATTMSGLPPSLIRSITWDQGIEMARHTDITADLGVMVYFCDSRSPWQRGSNENANGLLRQYFPKGHQAEHLHTRPSASCRVRDQQPTPPRPQRPQSRRTFHRAASLARPSTVATLTRTHPAARGSTFIRRRQKTRTLKWGPWTLLSARACQRRLGLAVMLVAHRRESGRKRVARW